MLELRGKYNSAKVFTDNIEETAVGQIIELCNQEFTKGSNIRIMPDTHAGAGCTIGTTMTVKDKVVPNLVGVDIGCGMALVNLGNEIKIDLKGLDDFIRNYIPSGQEVHEVQQEFDLTELKCLNQINEDRALKSIGTLGGGNHFIEVNKDNSDNIYIVIHSGSRYLGKQVAEYYQEKAYKELTDLKLEKYNLVLDLKKQGREKEIQNELKKISIPKVNKQLAYVKDNAFNDYIHDMKIVQHYAYENRMQMLNSILNNYLHINLKDNVEYFQTIHNYIDIENMILRKGAISAQKNEKVIIPMNMRDGSLMCLGKGNPDWNYSAPHGAGRLMSRSKAKENVTLENFKESMKGIYTTSVNTSTIDESPMAYKPMQEIIDNIQDTVDIVNIIKPIYNFKAGE